MSDPSPRHGGDPAAGGPARKKEPPAPAPDLSHGDDPAAGGPARKKEPSVSLSSLWSYLATHKRYWLLPMLSLVALVLLLLVLTRDSPESFVYTLF